MNVTVARGALFALVILTASIYLPHFYDQLFVEPVARSHLLYSPVAQEFVYSEKIVGAIPPEVRREAKDYHAEIGWRTAGGRWISRPEFERLLPFIYYKNMELQGLLPVHIAGRSFDKEEIKKGRRVIEVKAREMKRPRTPIYPLIESKPGRAGLIFSKYRFSATADGLRLINADTNRQDSMLSTAFSARLQQRGFRFPIRAVFGRFTVLKPFDMGAFLLDSTGRLFHLSYSHGRPSVAAVELPEKVRVKYLKISESRRHRYCGVLIGEEGRVWLLACSDCRFVPLPVRGYDPEKMDLKLIFNPVSVTAVFSDENEIHGLAMDANFVPVASPGGSVFDHTMSTAKQTPAKVAGKILFPFVLRWQRAESGFIDLHFSSSRYAPIGMLLSLLLYRGWLRIRGKQENGVATTRASVVVALFGVYALIGLFCVDREW